MALALSDSGRPKATITGHVAHLRRRRAGNGGRISDAGSACSRIYAGDGDHRLCALRQPREQADAIKATERQVQWVEVQPDIEQE